MCGSIERFHRFRRILRRFTTNALLSGAPSSNSSRWKRDTNEDVFVGSFTDYKTLAEFEELIEIKLRKIVERRCPQLPERPTDEIAARATWTAGSPFRGLEPFEFEHAPIFFGRTAAIGAALESLRKTQVDKDDPRGSS
jgi:hypothetical protein